MPKAATVHSTHSATSRVNLVDTSRIQRFTLANHFFGSDLESIQTAKDGESNLSLVEELIGDLLHFFFGHPFDAFHHLIYSEEPVEEKRLPRQHRHTAARRFQAQLDRTLQALLGP